MAKYKLNREIYRNLPQYKRLPDEDFDALFPEVTGDSSIVLEEDEEVNHKVEELMKEFEETYDLSEMLPNDKVILRNLAHTMVELTSYQNIQTALRKSGISEHNVNMLETINRVCSALRNDISKMQDDLKITRKTRRSDKADTMIQFLEDTVAKAKKFYESRMVYILCPKCNTLLATIWTLHNDGVTVHIKCKHRNEEGVLCGNSFSVNVGELKRDGTNIPSVIPERLR